METSLQVNSLSSVFLMCDNRVSLPFLSCVTLQSKIKNSDYCHTSSNFEAMELISIFILKIQQTVVKMSTSAFKSLILSYLGNLFLHNDLFTQD